MGTFGSYQFDLCQWVGSKVMTRSGKSNGEHLEGVMCWLFFSSSISSACVFGHLPLFQRESTNFSGILLHLEKICFLKIVLEKRGVWNVLGMLVCGTEGLWLHFPFPYLLLSSPHTYFVSFTPLSCVLLSIADTQLQGIYLGVKSILVQDRVE